MLFNSFEFILFLPIVFLGYWIVCRGSLTRNLWIIAASYLFYGWWDIKFLFLIFLTSLCSFASGLLIAKSDRKVSKRLWLICNIVINLGILCLFKYFNFFSHSFTTLLRLVGFSPDDVTLNLILPVGISFYTFQALSYSIDVYRDKIMPTKNLPAFLAFISFFPQLVAGPIERATNLLPQFQRPARFNYSESVSGLKLILWGLFKKVVVADNAAPIVNTIFSNVTEMEPINLWIGAFLFSFQIYGDFSGYSDMAIGIARLFGISLMRNFNMPYLSKGIHDFWKRWHISLTSWFRDYIYIPLGGNRKGRHRTAINTMTVFLLSGLWHGADLTFILWGAYHGVLYMPRIIMPQSNNHARSKIIPPTLICGITFFMVMIGWILFRADHFSQALLYIERMFHCGALHPIMGKQALLWCLILLATEILSRNKETPFSLSYTGLWRFTTFRWTVYIIAILISVIFAGHSQQFIYFQF